MGCIERGASSNVDLCDAGQRQEQSSRTPRMEGLPPADLQRGATAAVRAQAASVLRRQPRH